MERSAPPEREDLRRALRGRRSRHPAEGAAAAAACVQSVRHSIQEGPRSRDGAFEKSRHRMRDLLSAHVAATEMLRVSETGELSEFGIGGCADAGDSDLSGV